MLDGKTKPSDADSCLLENIYIDRILTYSILEHNRLEVLHQKKGQRIVKIRPQNWRWRRWCEKVNSGGRKINVGSNMGYYKRGWYWEIGLDDTDIENDTPEINSNEDCIAPIPEVSESPATTSAVVAGIQCAGLLKRKESDASLYVAAKKPRKKGAYKKLNG